MHSTSLAQRKCDHSKRVMCVWNWESQFDDDTVALFRNPLYQLSAGRKASEDECWTFPRCVSNAVASPQRHTGHFTAPVLPTALSVSVLRPRYHMPDLHVWSLCYLRWLTPVQIVYGGSPAELIVQQSLLSDIQALQQDIARLNGDQTVASRQPMHCDQHDLSVMMLPQRMSSSYPFAAYQLSNQTTQSGYCTASSVRFSYSEDSCSVDRLSVTDVSTSELSVL